MALAASLFLLVGCSSAFATTETPSRTLGPGEVWLPRIPESDVLCDLSNEIGGPRATLLGSPTDPRITWMHRAEGRAEVAWPPGYSARFTPQLEVLDDQGRVVARQGDDVIKLCPTPDSGVFWLMTGAVIPPAG